LLGDYHPVLLTCFCSLKGFRHSFEATPLASSLRPLFADNKPAAENLFSPLPADAMPPALFWLGESALASIHNFFRWFTRPLKLQSILLEGVPIRFLLPPSPPSELSTSRCLRPSLRHRWAPLKFASLPPPSQQKPQPISSFTPSFFFSCDPIGPYFFFFV